tara:strand:- start:55 stop:219 length:165 start_codon:yes stop_codon:yes gene_type:complete
MNVSRKLTVLQQLSDIEKDLKFEIEASYNEIRSDKLSKHHDNVRSLIKDLQDGI